MGYRFIAFLALAALLILSCQLIEVVPEFETEIRPDTPVAGEEPPQENVQAPPTATPTIIPTPTVIPTPTPTPRFLEPLSTSSSDPEALPRHGLIITFLLPLLILGVPWFILEFIIVRYVQPRGLDLTKVLIKAQDGLFIEAAVSMTARRTLTLASSRMSWYRVRAFMEKTVEQELIHEALQYLSLTDLEQNLKRMAEGFCELPIVRELERDFGVEVLWFNIEIRYPQETIDALKRRAEAAAGGTAYLAYAAAAHLDPDAIESRQLYQIFQETSSQVDAARNLGAGLGNLTRSLGANSERQQENRNDDDDSDC